MCALFARSLLILGLALSLFVGTVGFASANEGPWNVFFPWVPNGAMLGEMGPFTGAVTIQNLEAVPITVKLQPVSAPLSVTTRDLPPFGSVTVSAAELGVPAPGSGVAVWTNTIVGVYPARFTGAQKQTAAVAPHVPQAEARTSNAHTVVDGYTGLTASDIDGASFVLPIVQSNSGWNTVIRVSTNLADGLTGDVTVSLHPAGGGDTASITRRMNDGETTSFNLLDFGVPAGFVGSAVITSPVLSAMAVAERYKVSTSMLIINPARPTASCQTTHYAPLVFDNYHNWNTGISVANLGNAQNNVKITYYATDGTPVDDATLQIPANGQNFLYTPASGTGAGFLGAAVLEGTHPLCAVVDEVKYTGVGGDVGHAMAYLSTALTAYQGQSLALPLAQRGTPATGHGDTTGIQLFNVRADHNAVVEVYIYDQMGTSVVVVQENIPPLGSVTVYFPGVATVPDGFQGSAVVEVISGIGWVTGISNNVNYAVQNDGSASYSLVLRP